MRELVIKEKYNEKKLNTVLLDYFPNLKMNTLQKALRKKDIRVNDKRINENIVLHTGDQIKVFICDDLLLEPDSKAIEFETIYEDDNILVIYKPSGIEVVGENSVTSILENSNKYTFISPCHRIDRNTYGLVLFAKNNESLTILLDKFKKHEIEKHYIATVYGIPNIKNKRLEAYLFKDTKKSLVYISDTPKKGYQKIVTHYNVIKEDRKNNTSKLDITLETGRTHQIRAHLSHIGFPIIGDGKYGKNEINKNFNRKTQMLESTSITFRFITNSGILEYLNNKTIKK